MIETEQTVTIDVGIDAVWDYVKDMRRWADLMPGMREFTVINDDDSHWTLKVGVGGLVRTVNARVHVDEWAGPEHVRFSYQLEGDPVQGGGSYHATRKGPRETEIVLQVQVEGGGPMAPMWEAMGRPLLPQLAKGFAGHLKEAIEQAAPAQEPDPAGAAKGGSLFAWLRYLWRAIFGVKAGAGASR
jgi:carbon monoxide dehydrogenase subunit G